jgi:hypothetical protein
MEGDRERERVCVCVWSGVLTWGDAAMLLELGLPQDGCEIVPDGPEVRLCELLEGLHAG